jgi:transposase
MEVLYLKSQNLSHQQICQICCITRATLSKYLKQYQYGGRESLKELGYQGQRSKLNQHSLTIEQDFRNAPPRSIAEAVQRIEEITGIKRSPTQVGEFMKRIGMKTRKIGYLPGKAANEEKIKEQEQFRIEQLEPLLKEAKEEKRAVYFVEAAHFIHRAYLGFIWCFERIFIASPSGRKRFNVLGAINAVTQEIITVTNETYINNVYIQNIMKTLTGLKRQ